MNELLHVGVLGMRWGRRRAKQNAFYEKHGMRQPKSNADKYKVIGEKVVSKAKSSKKAETGKKIVDALMTPFGSDTKFSEMSQNEKKRLSIITGVAIAASGAMLIADLST